MKTKEMVLEVLNNNPGRFISGQEMADMLFVTRASVWKAIKSLEKEGHNIEAVTNKGYRIALEDRQINIDRIKNNLKCDIDVIYRQVLDSTNDEAIRLAREGMEKCVVLAGQQLKGRGRRGRSFYSPLNTGIYMSLLIPKTIYGDSIKKLTALTAVAVAVSIDKVYYEEQNITGIKWVNDIFVNDRKIAGILCENISNLENDDESWCVIGVGINIISPEGGFPRDIKDTAGAVFDNELAKDKKGSMDYMIASIVNTILDYIEDDKDCLEIYRDKSFITGSFVKINTFDKKVTYDKYAKVIGISDDYHLLCEFDDGTKIELSSAEVSVVKY